jgi:hypothetical protein
MSNFTTQVRFICENYAGYDESKGYASVDSILETSAPLVFDFPFPFYGTASERKALEVKILRHYYTREICCETVGRWKLFLEDRMNSIMPYYNQLYNSAKLQFDPLKDTNYSVNHDGDITSHGVTNGQATRDAEGTRNSVDGGQDVKQWNRAEKFNEWNLYSDTPQGGVHGILGAEDDPSLGSNGYLTDARHIIHDGTGTNGAETSVYGRTNDTTTEEHDETANHVTTDSTTDNNYIETVEGKRNSMTYSKMLEEYRKTMLNIDKMVIDELKDLFFTLWE